MATPPRPRSGSVPSSQQTLASGSRRDLVAAQAARLFALRGYRGASLRDIAEASGVRQPTLYSHYASKEAILVEVVQRYFDALLPELARAGVGDGGAPSRIAAMIRASVAVGVAHRDEFLTTSNNWELIDATPTLANLTRRRDDALSLWRAVLTAGAADGSLRVVDPYATLWIIASAINGMIDRRFATAAADASPPTETLILLLIEGLVPR